MATVDIKNLNNEVVGKLDLADAVFGGPINEGLMHLAVKQYLASLRSGTHKTKAFAQALARLGFDRKVLLIDHQENLNLKLAARNLSDVQLLPNLQVTPYHVLNARHVVFSS